MSNIVLVGLPQDHGRVRTVVDALHALGLDFWWEPAGPATQAAQKAAEEARCIILFFTSESLADKAYMAFATTAYADQKAIGARLDKLILPDSLAGMTVIDLTHFRGSKNDLFLDDLNSAADAKAKGIDPPPPRGPVSRMTKQMLTYGAGAFAMIALVIGFVSDVFGASSGLGDFLSRFDQPQRAAYHQAKTCDDLRTFERQYKDGYYVGKAHARTDDPKVTEQTVWTPTPQQLKLYISRDSMTPARAKDAAMQATTGKMQARATAACTAAATQLGGRFASAAFTPDADGWVCTTLSAGTVCGLSATATCQIDAPVVSTLEDCGTD